MSFQLNHLDIRGLKTSWLQNSLEDFPADTPILFFIHGFPDNCQSFYPQLKFFSKKFICVAPNLRGVGKDKIPFQRCRKREVLLDHLAILDHIDPSKKRPVVVVGHDIGVMHARSLAYDLGDRLKGWVLSGGVDPQILFMRKDNPRQWKKSWYILAFQIPIISDFLWNKFEDKFMAMAHQRNPANKDYSSENNGQLIYHYRYGLYDLIMGEEDHKIVEAPLLMIFGKDDSFLEWPNERELKKVSKDFDLCFLEGSHWLHQENEQAFNLKLENFLEGLSFD